MTTLEVTDTLAWSLIEARGEDARAFLQGQLTQDLDALDEDGAWTLVLAPDSVVVSVGRVVARDDGVDLVVPSELAEATRARLARFLLRSRCALTVRESPGPFNTEAERVGACWPGPSEIARSLTPHSFGRRLVDETISFTKGCFTGQELVGRLDARGASVPWRLVSFTGGDVDAVEEFLRSLGPAGPQGVTSALVVDGELHGLGVAHRSLLAATPPEGVRLREVD